MGLTPAQIYNHASLTQNVVAVKPQSFTDNTPVTGETVNRVIPALSPTPANTMNSGASFTYSAALIASGTYTVANGASGDAITVTLTVNTSAKSDMSSSTVLVAATSFTIPWVSNASGREFCVTLPVNFAAAQQYVNCVMNVHGVSAGGTYSAEVVSAVWSLGGLTPTPTPAFTDSGWVGNAT